MRTQALGSSSLVSSRLAYGCMRIAGTMDRSQLTAEREAAGRRAVLAALEAGYTHFDHAVAQRLGVSRTVLSLAWLLRHPAGIIPIVGSTDPARIRDAVRADGLELSREDWYTILTAARMQGLP